MHSERHSNSDSPETILGCHSLPWPQHKQPFARVSPGVIVSQAVLELSWDVIVTMAVPGLSWDIVLSPSTHTTWQSMPECHSNSDSLGAILRCHSFYDFYGLSWDVTVCLSPQHTPWQSIPRQCSNSDNPRTILGYNASVKSIPGRHSNSSSPGTILGVLGLWDCIPG